MDESICRCQVRRYKESRNAKYSVGECHGQIPNESAVLCHAEAHVNNEASKKVGGQHQNGISQQIREARQHLPIRGLTPQISEAPMRVTQNTFVPNARSLHLLVKRLAQRALLPDFGG